MKTRVQQYMDGNGKVYYRPEQWHWWRPIWWRFIYFDSPYSYCVVEFETEQEAVSWVNGWRQGIAQTKRAAIRNKVA